MIKSKKGNIKLEGGRGIIKADLCCIMRALKEERGFSKEEMLEIVDDAYMSDEELTEKAKERIEKMLEDIFKELQGDVEEKVDE